MGVENLLENKIQNKLCLLTHSWQSMIDHHAVIILFITINQQTMAA